MLTSTFYGVIMYFTLKMLNKHKKTEEKYF